VISAIATPNPICDLSECVKEAWRKACLPDPEYKLDPRLFGMFSALSGGRYRIFINNLIGSLDDARYLEIGTWTGSTLCSAINGNKVKATAIDNFQDDFSRFLMYPIDGKRELAENLAKFRTAEVSSVTIIEKDFRKVDYSAIGKFNVYLYDGPHSEKDQFDGIEIAFPALDDEFVLIVDDWNDPGVQQGTLSAIAKLKLDMLHNVFIWTVDQKIKGMVRFQGEWHNGVACFVLRKPIDNA